MAGAFEHSSFLENLGSTFRLRLEGSEALELELVEVSELQTTSVQGMFSIVFRCRSNSVLPQRIYRIEHDKMGQLDLFMVPIRQDQQGVYYEAVFNWLFNGSDSATAS